MNGRDKAILSAIGVAIAVVVVAIIVTLPHEAPVVPDDPDPEISPYPEGITFDETTSTLMSEESVVWTVVDQLKEHIDKIKDKDEYEGKSLTFDPGFYKVTVGEDTFDLIIDGKITKEMSWKYHLAKEVYDVSVSYEIDISELANIMIENREWNDNTRFKFVDLPREVYVNETVRSIVSQLESRYLEIGGSLEDRQSYADFLISFAQLGIKYPHRTYTWVDDMGNPVYDRDIFGNSVPKTSTDYEVWGCEEYWANSLETLFFGIGDCDDSAAVGCALFKAAGFRTAMVGVPGHVAASVALDSFEERNLEDYKDFLNTYRVFTKSSGYDITGQDTEILYYGVDTTKGQAPVGYLLKGSAESIGKETMYWGMAGYYPVPEDQTELDGIQ